MFQRFTHSIALHRVLFRPVIVFPGGLVILGVSIAMIVIGAQNLEACENDGAIYLVVTGSFVLGFLFLAGLGVACSPIMNLVPIAAFYGGVGLIAKLAIQIWGSITVFGESYWIHKFSHE